MSNLRKISEEFRKAAEIEAQTPIAATPATVTISEAEYKRLKRAELELCALQAGGVDNWEWYHESLSQAGLFDDDEDEDD